MSRFIIAIVEPHSDAPRWLCYCVPASYRRCHTDWWSVFQTQTNSDTGDAYLISTFYKGFWGATQVRGVLGHALEGTYLCALTWYNLTAFLFEKNNQR